MSDLMRIAIFWLGANALVLGLVWLRALWRRAAKEHDVTRPSLRA